MDLNKINALSCESFIQVFGNVIEQHSDFGYFLTKYRPFSEVGCFTELLGEYFKSLEEEEVLVILRKHPDLSGKISNDLTNDSKLEQKSAGLWEITLDQCDQLRVLNKKYREKFKFPFIICVRENTFDVMWKHLKERLKKPREAELTEAVYQVKLIALHRIKSVVKVEKLAENI